MDGQYLRAKRRGVTAPTLPRRREFWGHSTPGPLEQFQRCEPAGPHRQLGLARGPCGECAGVTSTRMGAGPEDGEIAEVGSQDSAEFSGMLKVM
ncbi:hypothetical protein NDU88_001854 [Pleurodeles waltl]|uniref:Uncharacterized protein n=1 Tax=Pleurodeles waltl TaxID=8319 RepID=A0AAV7M2C0_PLEWA|nr:hypothetical protein NDU88_001854 [Pleurodeles waltl]